jgi:HEAT repeat protein
LCPLDRRQAARTLAHLGREGIRALVHVLGDEHKSKARLRMAAAYGLGHVPLRSYGMRDTVTALFDGMKDKSPRVRMEILRALGRLATRDMTATNEGAHSVALLRARTLMPFIYRSLRDMASEVRSIAAIQLAHGQEHGQMLLIGNCLFIVTFFF